MEKLVKHTGEDLAFHIEVVSPREPHYLGSLATVIQAFFHIPLLRKMVTEFINKQSYPFPELLEIQKIFTDLGVG